VDEGADGGADGTDPLQRMPPEIKRFLWVTVYTAPRSLMRI
jgi:DNA replication licensing factor MCM7